MNNIQIDRALCLPASDVDALLAGCAIAALPRSLIESGWQFALSTPESEQILAIALCKRCQIIEPKDMPKLALATHWAMEELEQTAQQQPYLFVAALQVFRLPNPLQFSRPVAIAEKLGRFVALPEICFISRAEAVLSDRTFTLRAHRLLHLEPEPHANLIPLQTALNTLDSPTANTLALEIRHLLGWSESNPHRPLGWTDSWIASIAPIGNSSDGYAFERLVRQSFIKLGFRNYKNNPQASLDPGTTGGAGGIDFYCDFPYAIVGECKASKTEKVPDSTPAQLVKLGLKILTQPEYESAIKIIMAAGTLTSAADQTAQGNRMNVLKPETLQRLVELKAYYPGAIDLLKLKPCLEQGPFGEAADAKVNHFIDLQYQQIEICAHVVQVIRNHLENVNVKAAGTEDIDISTAFALYCASSPPTGLSIEQFKEILIEVSSPFVGCLGRSGGDRYYFLRELTTPL